MSPNHRTARSGTALPGRPTVSAFPTVLIPAEAGHERAPGLMLLLRSLVRKAGAWVGYGVNPCMRKGCGASYGSSITSRMTSWER